MKNLYEYCRQPRAYADSIGECVIELEGSETIEDVKAKYVDVNREWWQRSYSSPVAKTSYKAKDTEFTGNLVVMTTHQAYTG